MKKRLAFLFISAAFACAAFAEKKAAVKVVSAKGSVTYEVSKNKWEDVSAGMELNADAVINTGINSSITFDYEGKTVSVKALKQGKIADFANTDKKSGVKLGSRVKPGEIAADSEKAAKSTITASSRASEAKDDVEWDE